MIVVRATTATAPATRRRVVEASPVVGTLPLLVILETSLGLTEVLSPRFAAETPVSYTHLTLPTNREV